MVAHAVMLSAQAIAAALDAKPAGKNRWKARCPAHEDKNPSFYIGVGRTGAPLVKCWSGCSQAEVIAALKARGLWVARTRDERAPEELTRKRAAPRPTAPWLMAELERILSDAEGCVPDAPYIVAGAILEDAAMLSYQCVAHVATVLMGRSHTLSRHASRWLVERFPYALFEERPPDVAPRL